jgi:hypothetical protein
MVVIRHTVPVALFLALLGSSGSATEGRQPSPPGTARAQESTGMAGRVTGRSAPLPAAGVYAYQVADKSIHKVLTDPQGNFLFNELPAGLYQVIAHKPGFVPAIVMVTRATARSFQFLELQLAQQRRPEPQPADEPQGFWSLRARIPADVLREIETAEQQALAYSFTQMPGNSLSRYRPDSSSDFHTDIKALTGVDHLADVGTGQVTGGQVGVAGRLGPLQVGVSGSYLQMSASGGSTLMSSAAPLDGAQASSLAVDVAAGASSRISVSSLSNRIFARDQPDNAIDLERYHLSWSQALSDSSRSDFTAQYTSESNYHRRGRIDPREIPDASRTWKVEGAYTTDFGDGTSLQAGLRYRERQLAGDAALLTGAPALASIDLFGKGSQRLRPAVLVEYGMYSTLSDGSLALTPQGSLVLDLSPSWKLEGSASRRVYEDQRKVVEFLPALFNEGDLCGQSGKECYQVKLSQASSGSDNRLSLGAANRTIGETLRLYFSEEFFDRLESLYLVPGDRLPELQFSATRRLSPQVVSTLESSYASGGGGTFLTADHQAYKNRVRYVVTSLDTRFQATSTGVFVALHRVDQDLEPQGAAGLAEVMEFERLRIRLSQDLGALMSAASDWVLQLNFELSRASSPDLSSQDSRTMRRILGGIAVKF